MSTKTTTLLPSAFRDLSLTPTNKPVSLPYDLRNEMTWHDFANPQNPLGTPKEFLQEMHHAIVDGETLFAPDRDATTFIYMLAQHFDMDPQCFVSAASPYSLIQSIAAAFASGDVGVQMPMANEVSMALYSAGHNVVHLENPVSFALVNAFSAHKKHENLTGVVMGNPAFPASRLVTRQMLEAYLETTSWVIVDESFIELSFGGESMIPLTMRYENLIILRNPSVTFGMSGIPIAYAVAHPHTIERIRPYVLGNDISMFHEVLSKRIITSQAYIDQTHEYLDKEIPWMQCMLSLTPGLQVFPAEANFVLCRYAPASNLELGAKDAEELIIRLQLAGFMVRGLKGMSGIPDNSYFVVALRMHEENEMFIQTLRNIVSTIS